MYRCKECNAEYKTKPDYCDCGNDTFDYIEEKPAKHNLTLEEKSEIVSRIFFAICLIIAIGVWFIPMKTQHKAAPKQATKTNVQIPDINRIWNDTPIYQPKPEPQPVRTEPITLTPSEPVQKKNLTPEAPKKVPVTDVKQKVTEPPKSVQKPPQQVAKPATKPTANPVAKPMVKPTPIVEPVVKLEQPKPVYNPNSPAMIDYKTKLRAKLFSKFAVGSIQGSGHCSISFSVDKTGKLINRKFTQESDNKSLNDAVYFMLMSVPHFSAPPTEYNGEPIRMNFSINNGNYEISIY